MKCGVHWRRAPVRRSYLWHPFASEVVASFREYPVSLSYLVEGLSGSAVVGVVLDQTSAIGTEQLIGIGVNIDSQDVCRFIGCHPNSMSTP